MYDEQIAWSVDFDIDTNLYYYGARYYDPKVSVFLNVDPLAEQTMEPYAYVGNNPVMFVDPTGMASEESDDWVHYKDNNGKNQFIYDRDIKTVEQAKEKGYHNVQSVSNQIELKSGTENYKLSENATVTDLNTSKTVNTGFNLSDGSYVGENNMLKASAEGLQEGGDLTTGIGTALTIVGGGVVGVPLATLGSSLSTVGTGMELTNDWIHNKLTIEKILVKVGMYFAGNIAGKLGKNNSEKLINEGVITILDKVIDDARNNKKGPYKK